MRAVEGAGARIVSVMTLRGPDGGREIVVRVATMKPGAAVAALEARGYRVRDAQRGAPRGRERDEPGRRRSGCDEAADLLEQQGANPFRVRAYREAAHAVGGLPG